MKLVIIESPYAGDVQRNVEYARRCVRDSLSKGEAPIASHLLYTQPGILDDRIQDERTFGISAGHMWIQRCDLVAVYTDLGVSDGMCGGIGFAEDMKKPIEFRKIKDLKIVQFRPHAPHPSIIEIQNKVSEEFGVRLRFLFPNVAPGI